MKKSSQLLFLSFVLSFVFSCDKIEKPEKPIETNELRADTVFFETLSNPYQKILLEDFTGQTCVNCPQGHKKAADLKIRYGDTMAILSIHAGIFAEPVPNTIYTADYRTPEGDALNAYFGIQGYPSGLINRTSFMGNLVLGTSFWTSAMNALDRSNPTLAIQLKVNAYPSENKIHVFAKSTFLQSTLKNYKMALFLIEDSIVSPQSNNSSVIGTIPDIPEYVHGHVLRGALNSVWGTSISTTETSQAANSFVKNGYSFSFAGKSYVKKHCSIIAVVYDLDAKTVIQVEDVHLSE